MGNNVSKKKQWPDGVIYLQLSKVDHLPGDVLRGIIYLQLNKPYPGDSLYLGFKGREFNHWIVRRYRGNGYDSARIDHYSNKVETYNTNGIVYTWPVTPIPAGQYSFPFEMLLAPNLAPSFFFKGFECVGIIYYKVIAFLGFKSGLLTPSFRSRQMISIMQPMTILEMVPFYERSLKMTKCCFCDGGKLKMVARIEKTHYIADETVNVQLDIDASACNVGCKKIKIGIKQNLNLVGKNYTENKSFYLVTKFFPGIEAGSKANQLVSIKLPNAEPYHGEGKKEDEIVDGPPGTINSTAKGYIVDCSFSIVIIPISSNCLQKDQELINIPIIVNSSVYTPLPKIEAPPDWNPQVMETYKFGYAPQVNQNFNPNLSQFNNSYQGNYTVMNNGNSSMTNTPLMIDNNNLNQSNNGNIYNGATFNISNKNYS